MERGIFVQGTGMLGLQDRPCNWWKWGPNHIFEIICSHFWYGGLTLYIYCRANRSKCQSIGNSFGPNRRLLTEGDINFIGYVLARSYCGNNGMSRLEAMDNIQEVNPTLDQKQAKNLLERRVLPKAYTGGKIKRNTLKVQSTTTEGTAITYWSQWLWYSFVTIMFNYLRRNNGGCAKRPARHLESWCII